MVLGKPSRHSRATIMSSQTKLIKPKLTHELDLIRCHRTL